MIQPPRQGCDEGLTSPSAKFLGVGGPSQVSPERTLGDAVHLGDLAGLELAVRHVGARLDDVLRCHLATIATSAALGSSGLQAGHGALDEELALELGYRAQDVQNQL